MKNEKPLSKPEKMLVCGLLWIMIGCYENSWVGHLDGVHDKFYWAASLVFWIGGAGMLLYSGVLLSRTPQMTPPTSDLDVVLALCQKIIDSNTEHVESYLNGKHAAALARLVKAILRDVPGDMVTVWDDDIKQAAREIRGQE